MIPNFIYTHIYIYTLQNINILMFRIVIYIGRISESEETAGQICLVNGFKRL